jgi:S-adenosylmethionine synthetase
MNEGIYEVSFYQNSTKQVDYGNGIVTIKGDAINGGDEGFIYRGKLSLDGNRVTGRVHVSKWSMAAPSVFSGLNDYHLDFVGDFNDDALDGWGTVVEVPNLTLWVSAHRIGDAA